MWNQSICRHKYLGRWGFRSLRDTGSRDDSEDQNLPRAFVADHLPWWALLGHTVGFEGPDLWKNPRERWRKTARQWKKTTSVFKRLDELTEMWKMIVYTQTRTPGRKFFSKNSCLRFIYRLFLSSETKQDIYIRGKERWWWITISCADRSPH